MQTVSQSVLLNETLEAMEDNLRIPRKNATDFLESLRAVIEEHVGGGDKISLFGIAILTPKGVPAKPKRKGQNPRTGEEVTYDPKPAGVKISATVGKRIKDALPGPTTGVGKKLVADAKARAQAAAERRAEREAQAEKDEAKANRAAARAAKAGGKKTGGKKGR